MEQGVKGNLGQKRKKNELLNKPQKKEKIEFEQYKQLDKQISARPRSDKKKYREIMLKEPKCAVGKAENSV